jgi:hypothetical protein
MRFVPLAALVAISGLATCALDVAAAAEPVPQSLAPPAGLKRVLEASAVGVQIYRCKSPENAKDASAGAWILEGPRATLTDQRGEAVARHYAGPTWEAPDGSKITGKVSARADAPDKGAVAWLLLTAQSAGTPGRFDQVRAVQRLYTSGGAAPAAACPHIGESLEVPYRAMYVFWATQ